MANYSNEARRRDNAILEKYFTEVVTVNREKTKAIREKALPNIERLLQHIHDEDKHFEKEPIKVGSYTQGLGVNVKRDYDFNVVFRYNPDVKSNSLVWIEKTTSYYEPNPSSPGPDYCLVHIDQQLLLSPLEVREQFRSLLQNAIAKVDRDENLKLSEKFHGPALKIGTEVKTDDDVTHPVSIDLSVIMRAQLPFLPEMGWPVPDMNITRAQLPFLTGMPVPYVKWPSKDKIQDIKEKGINLVAKKERELHWQLSFAELEKLLVREIDKDGGCRKKVHRIMKSVLYTVCKENPTISTYILKNAWFHEIENFPDSDQWKPDCLGERYRSCLQRLIDCSKSGVLLQYFYRRVNLLEGKDISADVEKIRLFDFRP